MTRRRRRRLLRAGSVAVLLLAVLPSVLWLGHWGAGAADVRAAAGHDHANHCHGESSCADQAASGQLWWPEGGPLVLDSALELERSPGQDPSPLSPVIPPLDPPPRPA